MKLITEIKILTNKLEGWEITPKVFLDECHKILDVLIPKNEKEEQK